MACDVPSGAMLNNFASKPAGHIKSSNILILLIKRTFPAVLVFLWLAESGAMAQATGSIQGSVTDSSGVPILGAVVTVRGAEGRIHTTVTDGQGAFRISSVGLGDYSLRISAAGLSDWTAPNVPASVTPESNTVRAVLQVAPQVTTVTVGAAPEKVAAEQLNRELEQRALGVFPNYYVTYERHPAPLSPKQKLHLGLSTLLDPASVAAVGIAAGIQQEKNSYYQYGQGSEGYAKRFGAAYAKTASNILITSVLANSVLHQDPRYFYSGQGTKAQRAWYAIKSAFRAKGDNGKWQPPYSGLIGSIAAAEISQAYLPGSRTQYTLLGRNLMFRFTALVGLNLFQELLLKELTHHAPVVQSPADVAVLREGTPVPLIAVDGFGADGATAGQTVTFVLAQDVTLRGKVLARTGDLASGQVGQVSTAKIPREARSFALQHVTLRAGRVSVPLRSSQVRGVAAPVQYKVLESGKVEVTLFVAENVEFSDGE